MLSFVDGTAFSWGFNGPIVHRAAFELKSNLRAFMFVGAAYIVVAVLIYEPVDKPHGPALSAADTSPVELHRAVEH